MSQNQPLLLISLCNFDEATLIDNIHLTCIDLMSNPSIEEVKVFLTDAQTYLDHDLKLDIADELFNAIIICFEKFPQELHQIFEEYFNKYRSNSNYIIINTSILSQLTQSKLQLNIPDYQTFVSEALNDILTQIQNNESKLIIFNHEIPLKFKNELILNLLLLSEPSEEISSVILPYIFENYFFSNNPKFELLIQTLSKIVPSHVLPQTESSCNELIEFITKDDRSGFEISKMSENSFSILKSATFFVETNEIKTVEGLNDETLLPFISIVFIICHNKSKKMKEFCFRKDFLDATKYGLNQQTPLLLSCLKFIMSNFEPLNKYNIISLRVMNQALAIFLQFPTKIEKMNLVLPIIDFHESGYSDASQYNLIYKYIFENINLVIVNETNLNKLNFESLEPSVFVDHLKKIESTFEIDEFFGFIKVFCKHMEDVLEKCSSSLVDVIKEKNWDLSLRIVYTLKEYEEDKKLVEIKDSFPEHLQNYFFDPSKETFEELLSHILSDPHPEQNEAAIESLIDKMNEDKEMLHSYLCCFIFKFSKTLFRLEDFEKIFAENYKKYGDYFINAVNKVFYYQRIRKIMLTRPDFKISSLPVCETGFSVVSKLFEAIKKNPCESYQAFFVLFNIAKSFPFLFTEDPQQIFDLVLPSFDNFSLIFDPQQNEQKILLAKTSYLAMEFLFSTFHSTVVFDCFVKWFFENVDIFTNSQIYALICILRFFNQEKFINIYFQAFILKYNFFETLYKLLQREVKEEYFANEYKYNIYIFINETYQNTMNLTTIDSIYVDLIKTCDFPIRNIFENMYFKIPFSFEIQPLEFSSINSQLKKFIFDVHHSRKFWISDLSISSLVNSELDDLMKDFEGKLEKHDSFVMVGTPPFLQGEATIKIMKYFFNKPSFLFAWFINERSIPLVQEMYQLVLETANDLNNLVINRNEEDPDDDDYSAFNVMDYFLPLFGQHNLYTYIFESLMKTSDERTIVLLKEIVHTVKQCSLALLPFLEFICQNINEGQNSLNHSLLLDKLNLFLDILFDMHNRPSFISNFVDMCGNKLLDLILSPQFRHDSNLLIKTFNVFNGCENMPIRALYLAAFMIESGNEEALKNGLSLLPQIDLSKCESINSVIITSFDQHFDKTSNVSQEIIKAFLENYPVIANERKQMLLNYLKKLLEAYKHEEEKDQKEIEFIGFILTKLSPKRGKSVSLLAVVNNSTTIPNYIKETGPSFWELYEENQEMIQSEIEKEPSLLEHFRFLFEYPELTSFKIRSAFFVQKMNKKINKDEVLRFEVNSNHLLSSSFQQLHSKTPENLLNKFRITVRGEGGNTTVDAGGVTRQWFTKVAKELFNPNYGLFQMTKKQNFFPSPNSSIHPNHLEYFKFAGRFVARAMIEGVCIDAHFTSSFCKQILHREATRRDLADVDEELYKNFEFTLQNKHVEEQYMTFEVNRDEFGKILSFPLKENGENIDVTNENKEEYVDLYVDFILRKEIEKQIDAFVTGFGELIDHDEIKIFTPNELDMIICGIDNINVDDFIAHTTFGFPYSKESEVIKMFFEMIRKWDNEKLAKLLFFMTGATHLPPNGFDGFCECSGHLLKISAGGNTDSLPKGHTCFNQLDLPPYENEEIMSKKLLFAIYECDMITNY